MGILFLILVVTAFVLQDTRSAERSESTSILKGTVTPSVNASPIPSQISEAEQKEIDTWITENNLNQFGDPKETMYAGGSPLFHEGSGTRINRYVYIKQKHPDLPWKN